MLILAIDPGNDFSGWVVFAPEDKLILARGFTRSHELLGQSWYSELYENIGLANRCIIEDFSSYDTKIGKDCIDTIKWIGRYQERWEMRNPIGVPSALLVPRYRVKLAVLGRASGTDSEIRKAMISIYGEPKAQQNGAMRGATGHEYQALALAHYFSKVLAKLKTGGHH